MFVDRVTVKFAAGKGGNGVVAWRREKCVPKGGPWGGNGGKGGSIILVADRQVPSLEWYRNRRILKADDGQAGGAALRQGRQGQDRILKVPCGTLVIDAKTHEVIYDFIEHGDQFILCKGGKGGKGNNFFKTSTNQAPNNCTLGTPGSDREVELELKLIADIGLVGFPNAGKSTFMAKVTKVPVKIAAYPFTTLRPNLGYIQFEEHRKLLLADIPGIIAGAHNNRGLGLEFLRHIERTKVLIFLLDASGIDGRNPTDDFKVLQEELTAYDPELLSRPFIVALNKIDTEEAAPNVKDFLESYPFDKSTLFEISALTGEGVDKVLDKLLSYFPAPAPIIIIEENPPIIEEENPNSEEFID